MAAARPNIWRRPGPFPIASASLGEPASSTRHLSNLSGEFWSIPSTATARAGLGVGRAIGDLTAGPALPEDAHVPEVANPCVGDG